MPFFDLDEQERRSFLSVVRHTVLEGELRLVRFTDSTRGHEAAFGRLDPKTRLYCSYWMYASEIEELLGSACRSGPYGLEVIREISERWAICDDWGDLGRAWVMAIPAGRILNAYFGFAKFQPKISIKGQRTSGRNTDASYQGGSIQLVTRLGHQECRWVSGPLRTLDLSSKKLASLG